MTRSIPMNEKSMGEKISRIHFKQANDASLGILSTEEQYKFDIAECDSAISNLDCSDEFRVENFSF